MNAAQEDNLLNPMFCESPTNATGIAMPTRQPDMIPIASPQIGEELMPDKSWIIKPKNVAMKDPNRSE